MEIPPFHARYRHNYIVARHIRACLRGMDDTMVHDMKVCHLLSEISE